MRLFRHTWALWGLIVFAVTAVIIFPCYYFIFLFNPHSLHSAHRLSRFWGAVLMAAFRVRVRVHGKELIDKNKAYVFISNHRSQLDIPACVLAAPVTFRYLAKAELKNFPVIGYVISKLYVFVERRSSEGRAKSFEAMKKSLQQGVSVFIYPEGTRNRGPQELKEFYDGAFRLAIETKTPLAILTIVNSDKLMSPNQIFQLSPGVIDCYWEVPVDTAAMTANDAAGLKQQAKERMMKHLDN